MKKDDLFNRTASRAGIFDFDAQVAEVFDDMLIRSVPYYLEQQYMIKEIGRKFWAPGTNIYDLGCSTATTLINLCREIEGPAKFIGYDNSLPMIEKARQKVNESGCSERIEICHADFNGDLSGLTLENAGVVTLCWTLQFIRPLRRDNLIRWIYNGMAKGGALIVTEKILTKNTHMNRFFIDFYYDFKGRNEYSELEILRKREALENVLIPYRIDENLNMFHRNGFEIVETFFQWYNFAAFLCVKNPPQDLS
jgi:tRNA (cmo5U34)-methyltransferase